MKNLNTICRLLLVSVFMLAFGSCKDDFTPPDGLTGTPLGEVISTDANLNLFTAVIQKTGQYDGINNKNSGLVTAFAPSDAAFITYFTATYPLFFGILTPPVTEANVLAFLGQLAITSTPTLPTLAAFVSTTVPIINYHLVSSKLTASLITGNQVFATLNNSRLSISKTGTVVVLNANISPNGATVTSFDLLASNGVAHTIDRVMAVPSATSTVLTPLSLTINYGVNPPTIGGGLSTPATSFNLFAALLRVTNLVPTILPNTTPLPDFTVFQVADPAVITYLNSINPALVTEADCYNYIASLISVTPPPAPNPTLAQLTDLMKYHVVPGRFLTTDFTNGQVLTTLLTAPTISMGISPIPPAAGPYTYTLMDANAGAADATIIATNNILTNSGIVHTASVVLRPN